MTAVATAAAAVTALEEVHDATTVEEEAMETNEVEIDSNIGSLEEIDSQPSEFTDAENISFNSTEGDGGDANIVEELTEIETAIETVHLDELPVKSPEKVKTILPPLRPLTIAPKPTKMQVPFKPMPGQQLLLVQGSGAGQQIKLLSTAQGLNLSNLSLAKPITLKQATKPNTISLVGSKKMVMKKVVPKTITKAYDGKTGQQIVVLQKADATQMKLIPAGGPKTLTLTQAQQMGIIGGSQAKQIIVNRGGQQKAIKIIPQMRAPTKILPAPQPTTGAKAAPQRIILKQATSGTHILPGQLIQVPSSQSGQLHQINIPGKGMQYIKFVTTPSTDGKDAMSSSKATVVKVAPGGLPPGAKPVIKVTKSLLPATSSSLTTVHAIPTTSGQLILKNTVAPKRPIYQLTQLRTLTAKSSPNDCVVPTAAAAPCSPESANSAAAAVAASTADANGLKARKPCNCAKSQCLKLYCDCFANGEFCFMCNCMNCYNNIDNEEHRQRAIKNCLERNPSAFRPKIGKGKETGEVAVRKHTKGCNCKRSGCLKNYCECYEAKITCSSNCKCVGCKNLENGAISLGDADRTSLLDPSYSSSQLSLRKLLPDFARNRRSMTMKYGKPFTYINLAVIEATSQCLLTMAKNAEETSQEEETTTREIIEEFGRCLKQIIDCSTGKSISVK